jgi:hypothetical protein
MYKRKLYPKSKYPEAIWFYDPCCGARTRKGTPCKRRDVYDPNGRCKLHGGLSTGPRTEAGKKKAALNGLKRRFRKGDQPPETEGVTSDDTPGEGGAAVTSPEDRLTQ